MCVKDARKTVENNSASRVETAMRPAAYEIQRVNCPGPAAESLNFPGSTEKGRGQEQGTG